MNLVINSLNPLKWRYVRYSNGDSFHSVGNMNAHFGDQSDKVALTLSNYALFICMKITSDICSKAKFYVKKGDKEEDQTQDDTLVELLNKPNYLQTKEDFIKEFIWLKLANGFHTVSPILPAGVPITPDNTSSLFNINGANLKYPSGFKTPMLFTKEDVDGFLEQELKYEVDGQSSKYAIKDLMFYFDIANGLTKDFLLKSPSRLDAVAKSIGNINIALNAENIMLNTNGREMFSSGGGSKGSNTGMAIGMKPEDRKEILRKMSYKGLSGSKEDRTIIADRAIDHKSLHIALKELGLSDSEQKNAATIRNIFNIPETIFKLYLEKGDTFENKKEGEIELIQNVAQPHMDDFARTLTNYYGYEKTPLVARFDHVEAMQHIEDKKADKLLKISAAIRNLTQAGMTTEQIEEYIASVGITSIVQDG